MDGIKKSFWQDRLGQVWCFICPLCQSDRRVPFRPRPGGVKHFIQISLTSLILTGLFWKWLHWKGIVCFFPLWMSFELVYRWRTRAALRCELCGFDPFLFLIEPQWAKKEIQDHWRKKFAEKGIGDPYLRAEKPPSKPVS